MTSRWTSFFWDARIVDLLAQRDFEALLEKPRDVPVDGVKWDPTHGDRSAGLVFVTRSECDLQFARGNDGVLIEHLVEVPETKEDKFSWKLSLDLVILSHHGCKIIHGVSKVSGSDPGSEETEDAVARHFPSSASSSRQHSGVHWLDRFVWSRNNKVSRETTHASCHWRARDL